MKLVLSAMPEELEQLLPGLSNPVLDHGAGREFHRGKIGAETVVLAFSRWGKVAAAATVAHAVTRYKPDAVLFTGIAGALVDHLAVGDYVLADALVQHDLDASPFFAATEVPLLGHRRLPVDSQLLLGLEAAVLSELAESSSLPAPRLHRGTIATGDQVIGDSAARERVKLRVPEALCVEMEGAAVAQVCLEFGVPFVCLRMISDRADERIGAGDVFAMARASGVLTRGALQRWLAAD